ncbi:UDP-glucose 4-epimerase GalE [Caulobacter sp. SLTY]|uniref:UDP-glucose 4-epimerase GalE n=1 Tax=Caulobacter sp. SLTY TaxID=2683262 RepID=UPI001412F273|nr:UDP-glucose 4-epimerase GalE [Caulobacter sp. SLTY]NBB16047.1 UDP-glucose 4-epimerase GalE [Caulobacter sp. SLTY]
MSRTVFVTGGAGYVGSHCCKAFAARGWTVVVFDNLSRGWREFVRFGPLIEGDIRDADAIARAIAETKPDIVAHFAALAYVGESIQQPGAYYETNVTGMNNLLAGMTTAGVGRILFSSSCATFGEPQAPLIDETHPQSPINPYGWSKLIGEKMLHDYGVAHGLRSVALRYFNAAGDDPDLEIGEKHEPETHMIPLAIRAAMQPDAVFRINGDDFDTRDGTAVRDYVHVLDLADAHVRAIDHLMDGGQSDAFNLGTGHGLSVKEILDKVEQLSGRPIRREIGPRRPGDPGSLVASSEKAGRVLGWSPVNSDIDNILRSAWRWHELAG